MTLTATTLTTAAPAAATRDRDIYAPLELFDTNRLLDADERDIAATVRRFVDTRLKPNVEEWFESATLPRETHATGSASSACWGRPYPRYGSASTTPATA